MRARDTKNGEHGVADELLGHAPMALDLVVHKPKQLLLQVADVLRLEPFAERRRPREIGEEQRHHPALFVVVGGHATLATTPQIGSADRTERRGRGLLRSARGAGTVQSRTARAAETGVRRIRGSTRLAGQCHPPRVFAVLVPPLAFRRDLPARPHGRRHRHLARPHHAGSTRLPSGSRRRQ